MPNYLMISELIEKVVYSSRGQVLDSNMNRWRKTPMNQMNKCLYVSKGSVEVWRHMFFLGLGIYIFFVFLL